MQLSCKTPAFDTLRSWIYLLQKEGWQVKNTSWLFKVFVLVSFHFYWLEMEFCSISSRFLQAFRCSQASANHYSKTALAKSAFLAFKMPLYTPAWHRHLIANIGILRKYIQLKIFIHPILSRCSIRQTIASSFLLSRRKDQLEQTKTSPTSPYLGCQGLVIKFHNTALCSHSFCACIRRQECLRGNKDGHRLWYSQWGQDGTLQSYIWGATENRPQHSLGVQNRTSMTSEDWLGNGIWGVEQTDWLRDVFSCMHLYFVGEDERREKKYRGIRYKGKASDRRVRHKGKKRAWGHQA